MTTTAEKERTGMAQAQYHVAPAHEAERRPNMITQNPKVIVVLAAGIALLAASGCALARPRVRVGELQTKTESVQLDDTKSKSVRINLASGELNVSGGASDLLQAKFAYNVAELEPQVMYSGGTLVVRTPDVETGIPALWGLSEYRHEWDLQFNDNVPMEMQVEIGIGRADLKLGSLALTKLDLKPGAAPITVDLTGNWRNDLDAEISGGVGDLTVRLPHNACVRVHVEVGLGKVDVQGLRDDGKDYVNDVCGGSEATLRIHIAGGVGAIKLEVRE